MILRRNEQLEELLHRTLSEILLEEYEFPEGVVVTVSEVEMTQDLREAKVFLSIYPFLKKEKIFSFLVSAVKHIRGLLAKRLSLKYTPEILFMLDTREENAEEIFRLIDDSL